MSTLRFPLATDNAADTVRTTLRHFLSRAQRAVLLELLEGEEAEAFQTIVHRLAHTVATMPATYETDGQGMRAVAHLHYFTGSSDWYITERDIGSPDDKHPGEQLQAFGLCDPFGDGGELGYVSIKELIGLGAELDFHWTPKMLGDIQPA